MRVKVTVQFEAETLVVRGERVGPFVVHQGIDVFGRKLEGWCVTHAGTGYAACPHLPKLRWADEATALEVAGELAKVPGWDFTNVKDAKRRLLKRAGAIVRKFNDRGI